MNKKFDMEQLKRMSNEHDEAVSDDHVHEMPDGTMTGGEIEGSDNTHYHEYGEEGRTSMEPDAPGHKHKTELGETSEPK